jgi:hypothetical protein
MTSIYRFADNPALPAELEIVPFVFFIFKLS